MSRLKRVARARSVGVAAAIAATLTLVAGVSEIVGVGGAGPSNARAASPAVTTLPEGFQDTVALSGLTAPTAVRFASDGRIFVAEKAGVLREYNSLSDTNPKTVVDLSAEVNSFADRGLLGLALDPKFPSNPSIYLLYTRDAPPGQNAPYWNDTCPVPSGDTVDGCVVSGKLVRIQVAPDSTMVGEPTTLIQDQWCQQFTSHSIGDLQFGRDGMLYVSAGEGSNFYHADYGQFSAVQPGTSATVANPCGDPPEPAGTADTQPTGEGGSLRAQSARRTDGPALLSGTVIRVDPATGDGVPGNPFFASAPSDPNKQRIVAYGLRNPFRFTFRPGTSELWMGDVGLTTWEEIDRDPDTSTAANYGWPCYEGPAVDSTFNFSGMNLCSSLTQAQTVAPYYYYKHGVSTVPGDGCTTSSSSVTGMAFYDASHGNYPFAYDGALFFADHSRNCIWAMLRGADGLPDPTKTVSFVTPAGHPVDLQIGPGGDLFYADLDDGQIHRITYTPPAVGSCPVGSFDGQYFNNTQLSGQPTVERCDQTVAFAWGTSGPDPAINPNSFSARWTGSFDFSAGKYQFTATAADGIRVSVDGSPLIDKFIDQPATTYTTTTQLSGGTHQVTVEYSHRSGSALASVNWQPVIGTPTPTPTPTPKPKPTPPHPTHHPAKLLVPRVLRIRGHTAKARLRCVGSERCVGSVLIQRRVAVSRKHRRTYVMITLASGRFSIPANAARTVTLTLSGPGKKAIAKRRSLGAYAKVALSRQRPQSVRITLKR